MSHFYQSLNDDTPIRPMWKLYLYELQKEAPKPSAVFCLEKVDGAPHQYGLEYHGLLHRHKCQQLLMKEGNYLIRRNKTDSTNNILSVRFSGVVKHYRLYYDGRHYVGEKKFDKLDDLIADGLVILFLESRASKFILQMPSVNYKQSPYFKLNRSARQALKKTRHAKLRLRNQEIEGSTPDDARSNGSASETVVEDSPGQTNGELSKPESDAQPSGVTSAATASCTSLDKSDPEDRPHRFNNHTFTGLHWCGFCGNFLWGLMLQGVKCADCGLKAHRPCSLKVPNDCCPDLKNVQGVFGMDLTTSLQKSCSRESLSAPPYLMVPSIVSDCIAEVEARGLLVEGIYRVPGSHEQIDSLRLSFERDPQNVCLEERSVPDINVVAGLLKMYFRCLPLRLITSECFDELVETNKLTLPDDRSSAIKEALNRLPLPHYHTLRALITHLSKVCDHGALNRMNATSLSTIFGPTLVDPGDQVDQMLPEDLLALKMSAQEPRVIEALIVHHKDIFGNQDPK